MAKQDKPKKRRSKDSFVTEITPRSQDFSKWYLDVVRRAELADYSPVKGCMVIRPYGYAIWELIQQALDKRIKATGHVNAYFPLFIPESLLNKEAEHVEGFAPQVAYVTHGGGEELEEKLVVRPTSEAIIGTMYAKWVQSWRDLPILINQWANVVRWEKVTRPFLRTTEFLWQEGHTAHETDEEAEDETLKILHMYKETLETEMARAGRRGAEEREREVRRRAPHLLDRGADGRRPRAAGRHVAQPRPELREGVRHHVPGARQVGAARLGHLLGHDDAAGRRRDHGARRRQRPRAAAADRAVPGRHRADRPRQLARDRAAARAGDSARAGGRRHPRHARRARGAPGWKFAEWELRGVPLRLEIGPKDIEKSAVLVARRDTREKQSLPMDGLPGQLRALLDAIQKNLFDRAVAFRDEHTQRVATYDEFKQVMEGRPGFVIAPWCGRRRVRGADQDRHAGDDPQHAAQRHRAVRPLHPLRQPGAGRGLVREELLEGG